jgi:hypothetical protein
MNTGRVLIVELRDKELSSFRGGDINADGNVRDEQKTVSRKRMTPHL